MKKIFVCLSTLFLVVGVAGIAVAVPTQFSGNNHWYDVVWLDRVMTWEEARDRSVLDGGYLVTLTGEAENLFVFNFLNANLISGSDYRQYWLGGYQTSTDDEPHGNWAWVTGEVWDYDLGMFDNWNGIQHYLHFWTDDGRWDDIHNGWDIRGYIVEYDHNPNPNPIPEPTTVLPLSFGLIGFAVFRKKFKKS